MIITVIPTEESLTDFSFEYWVEGVEYTKFEKVYMKYLVWDENADAFRIMAIACAGVFALLILCCFCACIKKCTDKNKVNNIVELDKQNTINSQKY